MRRLTELFREMALYFGLAEETDDERQPPLAKVGTTLAVAAELVRRAVRRSWPRS